ncbi:MAG TPA: glycosyltransferase [Vicinamibacterales bacterium]|jgi:glycosyltransferase involved in cell wall biosynthesis|nr:glycosyltransferase [Vicinamibacterales bacterium]
MKVAHVGPPLARQGGPAGYLFQLCQAAAIAGALDGVTFPEAAPSRATATRPASRWSGARQVLSKVKRAVGPAPRFDRPSDKSLRADHGHVETIVAASNNTIVAEAQSSFDRAQAERADVLFCHDAAVAERALDSRQPGQSIWLMVHTPMPAALYMTWNWGVPEKDWREIMTFQDVRRWTAWELAVWSSVDRLIIPCREAFGELVRIDPSVARLERNLTYVLSGASLIGTEARATISDSRRQELRRRFSLPLDEPVGLFLGSGQAYRGLDALVRATRTLKSSQPGGGVAVAGPAKSSIQASRRLIPLGPIADVRGLLAAVDFVVNVNRFSLFDLSTIEALEAGKPLLMHAVGGNNTFRSLGAGCLMLSDLEPTTIADGLSRMFAMTSEQQAMLGAASRRCYEQHLTLEALWSRHAALYECQRNLQSAICNLQFAHE